MDVAKYRTLFIEEASEHLVEWSRALLALEKDPGSGESLELLFRMAHSIKGMAASLDYQAITEVAHAAEDRLGRARAAGRLADAGELPLLFRALEGLERMVGVVRESGEAPAPDPELVSALRAPAKPTGVPEKKAPRAP